MIKIEENPNEKFVLEMSRRFSASRERLFDAFSRFESMSLWFGPHGCHVSEGHLDFVVGGRYRMVIQSEENESTAVGGVFKEVIPPAKLVFSWQWEPRGDLCSDEMEVTLEFIELGPDASELHLRQILVPDKDTTEHHGWGWTETFERLAEVVEE